VVSTSRSYDALRQGVELAPHGAVHVGIGSDMSTMYSPNDPIFYAHHAYIDKIWSDWQAIDARRLRDYSGHTAQGTNGQLTDVLAPWNTRVQDVMDTTHLCYRYQAFSRTAAAPVTPAAPAPSPSTPSRPAPGSTRSPSPSPPSSRWDRFKNRVKDIFEGGDDNQESGGGNDTMENGDDENGGDNTDTSGSDDNQESDDGGDDQDANMWLVRRQTPPATAAPVGPNAPETISAGDRSVLTGVRVPEPLPQAWCSMNRIPVQVMRKQETVYKKICNELNKIPGYISPASLWMREELTKKLITPTKKFIYYMNGRPMQVTPQKGYSNPLQGVKDIKDSVRRRIGGHLRAEPRYVWNALQKVVGPVVYPVLKHGPSTPARMSYY